MLGRKRDRDLLLASLHEDLSSVDQARLDKALENSADLRKEHDDLRLLVAAIPRDESDLNIDLLPLVRRRLEGPAAQHETQRNRCGDRTRDRARRQRRHDPPEPDPRCREYLGHRLHHDRVP